MAEPNPLGQEAETLTLARERIRVRFQCTEEEAAERLRRSIQDLFNEPDIPDQPPGPQQDPPPKPPGPPQVFPIHPDPQIEDNTDTPPKKRATFVDFDLNAPIASRVPHSVEQAQVYSIYYSSTLILPVSGEGRGC